MIQSDRKSMILSISEQEFIDTARHLNDYNWNVTAVFFAVRILLKKKGCRFFTKENLPSPKIKGEYARLWNIVSIQRVKNVIDTRHLFQKTP